MNRHCDLDLGKKNKKKQLDFPPIMTPAPGDASPYQD